MAGKKTDTKNTKAVSDAVFKAVYDSLASLPGRYKWLIKDSAQFQMPQLGLR